MTNLSLVCHRHYRQTLLWTCSSLSGLLCSGISKTSRRSVRLHKLASLLLNTMTSFAFFVLPSVLCITLSFTYYSQFYALPSVLCTTLSFMYYPQFYVLPSVLCTTLSFMYYLRFMYYFQFYVRPSVVCTTLSFMYYLQLYVLHSVLSTTHSCMMGVVNVLSFLI